MENCHQLNADVIKCCREMLLSGNIIFRITARGPAFTRAHVTERLNFPREHCNLLDAEL